jgi:glutamate synthase domain-containing protein 3
VEAKVVKDLVARHFALTASPRAAWILNNWTEALARFIKVFPHEHKRVLGMTRRRQPYIPSAVLAVAAQSEQVSHG